MKNDAHFFKMNPYNKSNWTQIIKKYAWIRIPKGRKHKYAAKNAEIRCFEIFKKLNFQN